MSDKLRKPVINRIQEQLQSRGRINTQMNRKSRHLQRTTSLGFLVAVQHSLSGPPVLDTGEYSVSRPAALPPGKRTGYKARQLTDPHWTLWVRDKFVRDIRSSRWRSSELCRCGVG